MGGSPATKVEEPEVVEPGPPGTARHALVRYLNAIREADFDGAATFATEQSAGNLGKLFNYLLDAFRDAAMGFDQQHDDVSIRRTAPRCRDHSTIQPAARTEQPRRIDENELRFTFDSHATNTRARCLNLMRYNGYLCADHLIGQCRFSRVGFTDERYETGPCGH